MDKARKRELVAEMREVFTSAGVIVVAGYSGLTVAQLTDLRDRIRASGGFVKVVKNRLARRSLAGTDVAIVSDLFKGPVLVACSDDLTVAPRVSCAFAKDNEHLVILGGVIGTTFLDQSGVKTLAELPSIDELRAKIIGVIQMPATLVAGVLQAPAKQLSCVLKAYSVSGDAA